MAHTTNDKPNNPYTEIIDGPETQWKHVKKVHDKIVVPGITQAPANNTLGVDTKSKTITVSENTEFDSQVSDIQQLYLGAMISDGVAADRPAPDDHPLPNTLKELLKHNAHKYMREEFDQALPQQKNLFNEYFGGSFENYVKFLTTASLEEAVNLGALIHINDDTSLPVIPRSVVDTLSASERTQISYKVDTIRYTRDELIGSLSTESESYTAISDIVTFLNDEFKEWERRLARTLDTIQRNEEKEAAQRAEEEAAQEEERRKELESTGHSPSQKEVEEGLELVVRSIADRGIEEGSTDYLSGKKLEAFEMTDLAYQECSDDFPYIWGYTYINNSVSLPRSLPPGLRGKKHRATDTGGAMKYVNRYCADKMVFSQKLTTHQGGAVLIDTSGSMSLRDHQILEIMEALPGAIIAVYAGAHYGVVNVNGVQYHGECRIVARKGKRALKSDLRLPYGGNVIDGNCVDWLALQDGPRYWVTDGGVTWVWNPNYNDSGKISGEASVRYLIARLSKTVRQARIQVVSDVDSLIHGVLKVDERYK